MSVWVWLLFAAIFAALAADQYRHVRNPLDVPRLDLGFSDLNEAYNATRAAIIAADRRAHSTGTKSYTLAAVVAAASAVLTAVGAE